MLVVINDEKLLAIGHKVQGPILLCLVPGEEVIGEAGMKNSGAVCLATKLASMREISAGDFRRQKRGDGGQLCM